MVETLAKFNIRHNQFIWFDCESFDNCESYIDLFEDLMRISAFRFSPENVQWQEGWSQWRERYLAEVSFRLKSNPYKIKVSCDEWFDPDLMTDLNSIISIDNDFEERFYPIETGDQTLIIAFLNIRQYSELERNNLTADINKYTLGKDKNWDDDFPT